MGAVVDRTHWPVVTVSVEEPADLDLLADELERMLAEEQPFALTIAAPRDLGTLQRMLWAAPNARRRLRRLRASNAAWCEAAAHVLAGDAFERTTPSDLRYAELIWGCAVVGARTPEEAGEALTARLAGRPRPLLAV